MSFSTRMSMQLTIIKCIVLDRVFGSIYSTVRSCKIYMLRIYFYPTLNRFMFVTLDLKIQSSNSVIYFLIISPSSFPITFL
jgi:hypothetical protein